MNSRPTLAILALATALGAVGLRAQQAPVAATRPTASAAPLDFNWDVRPILSDNCFRCHGSDTRGRMANLRLDQAESAYAERRSGSGRFAIVPGQPDRSEVIARITNANPRLRMPPESTHKVLTPAQIDIIRTWIAQGAPYKPHWSFIPPSRAVAPVLPRGVQAVNDIDRFVRARLQRAGIAPSREGDRETLINRVSLALTGLPPTLADVDAFLADASVNAYEKVVDRLLASTAYGEHMGAYWMNMARYSESDGFLDDLHDRFFWPYRDWVIGAFNKNMPFNEMSTWQIAGDLMPSHTREQKLATAFLRLGKRTTENGAIDEEYRVEYAVERADVIGQAFLGLTVGCARCHDHKYDPISHKDFYSLTGFFNSTDEPGYYAPGNSRNVPGPTLPWTTPEDDVRIAAAAATVAARASAYAAARSAALPPASSRAAALARGARADVDRLLRESTAAGLVAHYPFEESGPVPDDQLPRARQPQPRPPRPPAIVTPEVAVNVFAPPPAAPAPTAGAPPAGQGPGPAGQPNAAGGARGRRGAGAGAPAGGNFNPFAGLPADLVRDQLSFSLSLTPGVAPATLNGAVWGPGPKGGRAFYFDDLNKGFLAEGVGYFERTQPFSVDLWVLPGQLYDEATVINHRDVDAQGNAGYTLQIEKGHLRFDLKHSRAGNMIRIAARAPIPVKVWSHVAVTYDGSSTAAGTAIYVDGQPVAVDVISDNLTRSARPVGGNGLNDAFFGLTFGKRFREFTLKDGAIDEIRVFNTHLTPLEVRYLHDPAAAVALDAATLEAGLADVLTAANAEVRSALAALGEAREAQNQIVSVIPQIMVMGDTHKPRPTYLLLRGVYSDRGEEVPVKALDAVLPWDPSLPANRLGLAQWLFDARNPLTARVFVNRMWQMHFGRGIVDTVEDFGSQSAIPSHPELLDWLATEFVASGWDIKKLHKLIVMSATYRQSSVIRPDLRERDPENRLLARGLRLRMPAELVRDNALAASGLLNTRIGGPSVYPYQAEGVWDGVFNRAYPLAENVPADDHHRRTLYSFAKRNAPNPAFAVFDMPDRTVATVRRRTSNTPLQALVLLDDPQYLEAYRALGAQALRLDRTTDAQITRIFRLATRRKPMAIELTALRRFHAAELAKFIASPEKADALLSNGVSPIPEGVDRPRLAALMNVATAIMNAPDAYWLR